MYRSRRLPLTYEVRVGDHRERRELPFKILLIGDFTGRPNDVLLAEREEIRADDPGLVASMLRPDLRLLQDEEARCQGSHTLRRAWRGLTFLLSRVDFNENIEVGVVSVTKQELAEDFDDSPGVTESGLYRHLCGATHDGVTTPVGMILGDYDFDCSVADLRLLRHIARVAALAHAPFITNTSARFFDCKNWEEVAKLRSLDMLFGRPEYADWREFRETDAARYVGMLAPGLLPRVPTAEGPRPWVGSAFAFATGVVDSFARWRSFQLDIGHRSHSPSRENEPFVTDAKFTMRRVSELSDQGFICLVEGQDGIRPASVSSVQRPRSPRAARDRRPEEMDRGREQIESLLPTQLPYILEVARFAHYLKAVYRENSHRYRGPTEVELELNRWLANQTRAKDNSASRIREHYHLRDACVQVQKRPDHYEFTLRISPLEAGFPLWVSATGTLR